MVTLLLHIANADAIKVDVDGLPDPTHVALLCRNPRERTDKEVNWLEEGVTLIMFPWWRINFIEILPDQDAQVDFPLPFRED
ncbi:MAG: hypothetical protein H7175_16250 [Burkholderiales bacterium]|nr:hypothetical protein [Anaerolineae bacterium]